jgi:hypothetical protein
LVDEIEVEINGLTHKVALEHLSGYRTIRFEGVVQKIQDDEIDKVYSEIIRLCQLGQKLKKSGLTEQDLSRVEKYLVIKPADVSEWRCYRSQ